MGPSWVMREGRMPEKAVRKSVTLSDGLTYSSKMTSPDSLTTETRASMSSSPAFPTPTYSQSSPMAPPRAGLKQ